MNDNRCVYPYIMDAIKRGKVAKETISELVDIPPSICDLKLKGEIPFDINEAMTISKELFPDIPFKILFTKSQE